MGEEEANRCQYFTSKMQINKSGKIDYGQGKSGKSPGILLYSNCGHPDKNR